jgi:ankyrin repeat protein
MPVPRFVVLVVVALAVGAGWSPSVRAQVAPSATEIAADDGLHRAAHGGDVAAIRRLAAAGADVNARDGRGRTPVHVAAFASQDDALRALAAAGADMNALEFQAYDAVTIAAVADDPELMSLAIELGNDPGLTTSPYDGTALIAAAHLGHAEVVRRLVAAGAPLDHVNNLGWTALIEAVILGDGGPDHVAVVRALLAAGADRTIADRGGVTPLQHARTRGYGEMERLLAAD